MSEYEKVKKKWPVLPFAGFFIDYSIPVNPTELPLNDDSMLALCNLSKNGKKWSAKELLAQYWVPQHTGYFQMFDTTPGHYSVQISTFQSNYHTAYLFN